MKRYLSLLLALFKNNLIREMEFRGNFVLWATVELFWLALQIAVIQIFFQYTNSIAGWTKEEVFLLVGLYRIVRGLYGFFTHINLANLPELVTSGELDYVISKPLNSLFLPSFRHQEFSEVGTIIFGGMVVLYSSSKLNLLTLPNAATLIFFVLLGSLSLYCLTLLFVTLSFYLTRLRAVNSFFDVINNLLIYPTDIFNKQTLSLILPLAVVVTLPSKILLTKTDPLAIILEVIVVGLLFLITIKFWSLALKRYSSASS